MRGRSPGCLCARAGCGSGASPCLPLCWMQWKALQGGWTITCDSFLLCKTLFSLPELQRHQQSPRRSPGRWLRWDLNASKLKGSCRLGRGLCALQIHKAQSSSGRNDTGKMWDENINTPGLPNKKKNWFLITLTISSAFISLLFGFIVLGMKNMRIWRINWVNEGWLLMFRAQ